VDSGAPPPQFQSDETFGLVSNRASTYSDAYGGLTMGMIMSLIVAAAQPAAPGVGTVVQARGAGVFTCATAFLSENRVATENWIAGYWAAWDMAQINVAEPVAANSDLNGIVGEVEKVCRAEPSTTLLFAVLSARKAVKERWAGAPRDAN
jgi:hypothetical protein